MHPQIDILIHVDDIVQDYEAEGEAIYEEVAHAYVAGHVKLEMAFEEDLHLPFVDDKGRALASSATLLATALQCAEGKLGLPVGQARILGTREQMGARTKHDMLVLKTRQRAVDAKVDRLVPYSSGWEGAAMRYVRTNSTEGESTRGTIADRGTGGPRA
ncbi:hypothetical protein N9L68_01855 [bacterium]|nr:hypothetical protein [bacterium]